MTRSNQRSWLPGGHLAIQEVPVSAEQFLISFIVCGIPGLSAICLVHWTLLLPVDRCDFFFANRQDFFFVGILGDFDCLTKRWIGAEFKNWILDALWRLVGAPSCLASSRTWSQRQLERVHTFAWRRGFLRYTLDDALPVELVDSLSIFIKTLTSLGYIWPDWNINGSYIFIRSLITRKNTRKLGRLHTSVVPSLPAVGFLVCGLKVIDAFEKVDYIRLLCKLYRKTSEFPTSVSLNFQRSSTFRKIKRRLGFCFMIEIEIIDLQLFELGVEGSPIWFFNKSVLSFSWQLPQNTHRFRRRWRSSAAYFHRAGSDALSEARRPSLCVDANLHELLLKQLHSFLLFLQSDLLLMLLGKNMINWISFHLFPKGCRSRRDLAASKACFTYWLQL